MVNIESNALISYHPKEYGVPDLSLKFNGSEIIALEVTGTERQRGSDYWIRPDKLIFAKKHTDQDVWIVLHYGKPQEKFVWIQPDNDKSYSHTKIKIRGAVEYYVSFKDHDKEVHTSQEFYDYVIQKLK